MSLDGQMTDCYARPARLGQTGYGPHASSATKRLSDDYDEEEKTDLGKSASGSLPLWNGSWMNWQLQAVEILFGCEMRHLVNIDGVGEPLETEVCYDLAATVDQRKYRVRVPLTSAMVKLRTELIAKAQLLAGLESDVERASEGHRLREASKAVRVAKAALKTESLRFEEMACEAGVAGYVNRCKRLYRMILRAFQGEPDSHRCMTDMFERWEGTRQEMCSVTPQLSAVVNEGSAALLQALRSVTLEDGATVFRPSVVWNYLSTRFRSNPTKCIAGMQLQLVDMRPRSQEALTHFYSRFSHLNGLMTRLRGSDIGEDMKYTLFSRCLSAHYVEPGFVAAVRAARGLVTADATLTSLWTSCISHVQEYGEVYAIANATENVLPVGAVTHPPHAPRPRCTYCQRPNHEASKCFRNPGSAAFRAPPTPLLAQPVGGPSPGGTERRQCHGCKLFGHIRANCPNTGAASPPAPSSNIVAPSPPPVQTSARRLPFAAAVDGTRRRKLQHEPSGLPAGNVTLAVANSQDHSRDADSSSSSEEAPGTALSGSTSFWNGSPVARSPAGTGGGKRRQN